MPTITKVWIGWLVGFSTGFGSYYMSTTEAGEQWWLVFPVFLGFFLITLLGYGR